MYKAVMLILGLCIGVSLGCTPVIDIQSQDIPKGSFAIIKCDIRGDPECAGKIDKMAFEKRYGDNDIWGTAGILDLSDQLSYFEDPNLKDGYSIEDRSTGSHDVGWFELFIDPANVVDSGMWRCRAIDDADPNNHNYLSDPGELSVIETKTSQDIQIDRNSSMDYIVLTRPYKYTCTCNDAYPDLTVTWQVDGQTYLGSSSSRMEGYLWTIENSIVIKSNNTQQLEVYCILSKTDGTIQWESNSSITNNYRYPAIAGDSGINMNTVNLTSDLEMYCIGSGSDISIAWILDDYVIDVHALFEVDKNVSQDGLKQTIHETLTWIPPKPDDICGNIDRHSGEYICKIRGLDDSDDSRSLGNVTVNYAPAGMVRGTSNISTKADDTLFIDCPACAEPRITKYGWTMNNGELRDGIEQFENGTLHILKVAKTDISASFECSCSNSYGFGSFPIKLIAASSNALTPGEIAGIVIGCIAFIVLVIGIAYMVKKKTGVTN